MNKIGILADFRIGVINVIIDRFAIGLGELSLFSEVSFDIGSSFI